MKIFSMSVFLLSLLILLFWAITSWYFSEETKKKLELYFKREQFNSTSIMNFQILKYNRSPFGSRLKVRAQLNTQNAIAQLIQNSLLFEVDEEIEVIILNGPIFFAKSGVQFGSSFWRIEPSNKRVEKGSNDLLPLFDSINKSKTHLISDFENKFTYQIPVKTHFGEMVFSGTYDPITAELKGRLSSGKISIFKDKSEITIAPFDLNYVQLISEDENSKLFNIYLKKQELTFKQGFLNQQVAFEIDVKGESSITENRMSSDLKLDFKYLKKKNKIAYPIDQGDITINVNDISIDKLLRLSLLVEEANNSQEKSQWLLEELGEYPEGQDQSWLEQDMALQQLKQIPLSLKDVLIKISDSQIQEQGFDIKSSKIHFTLNSFYQNKKSTLNGALLPLKVESVNEVSNTSLLSLLQLQTNVNLNEELQRFISQYIPIKKQNFKLIYKQNKLLMQ